MAKRQKTKRKKRKNSNYNNYPSWMEPEKEVKPIPEEEQEPSLYDSLSRSKYKYAGILLVPFLLMIFAADFVETGMIPAKYESSTYIVTFLIIVAFWILCGLIHRKK